MKKTILLLALSLLHFSFSTSAQNFLWGRSGGSSDPSQGADDETVTDIATDRNGNVYILAPSLTTGRNAAGQPLPSYGYCDIVLSSFSPNGTFRWAKVIGGGRDDYPKGLQTDAKDGVYVAGYVNTRYGANISTDVVIPAGYKSLMLVKYDTSGVYQWHKLPEADTVTSYAMSNNGVLTMDVDAQGNAYLFCSLGKGLFDNSLTVNSAGQYILKYDAAGGFSSIKPNLVLDGPDVLNGIYITVDDANGKFYLSGKRDGSGGTMTMGGNTMTNAMYIGSFNMDGSFNWKRENKFTYGGFFSRPAIDGNGNIYLCGGSRAGTPVNDNFNGYEVTHGGGHSTPFVIKMDKNGNNVWGADAEVNAGSSAIGIALRNNEIVISGDFPGLLEWPGYSGTGYNKPVNEGYDVFITRFDAGNGAVLGMDRVSSSFGYSEFPTTMASDGKGNVYIGGEFAADMNVNSLYNLASTGGQTDWFVIKYGDMWPANVNAFVSDKDVLIYPNPAYDKININNARSGTTLQLSDMAGRVLQTQLLHSNQEKIDVASYPTGSYIIRLIDKNGGNVIRKIVKG